MRRKTSFPSGDLWRYGETFEYIAENGDGRWVWGLTEHALSRMYKIETAGGGAQDGLIAALWAILPEVDRYTVEENVSIAQRVKDVLVRMALI